MHLVLETNKYLAVSCLQYWQLVRTIGTYILSMYREILYTTIIYGGMLLDIYSANFPDNRDVLLLLIFCWFKSTIVTISWDISNMPMEEDHITCFFILYTLSLCRTRQDICQLVRVSL